MDVVLSLVAVLLAFSCLVALLLSEYRDYRKQKVATRSEQAHH